MNFLIRLLVVLCCMSAITGCKPQASSASTVTIGIVEPLEHRAMDEIVAGFSDTLKKVYPHPVIIKVENAQNDMNLKRAIIEKMKDSHYTIIVPIGMDATQMAISMVHDQPIVSLASDLSEKDRHQLKPCHVAVVHDEISSTQLIQFIHAVYPSLTRLTLIHSSANKVFPEVKETIAAGKAEGITIHHIMVSSLPELYNAANSIPQDTQAIFILKDSLIVSGIATLEKIAEEKHLPLITSDQGSVQEGAGFALGVHEREIGVEGAKLTAAILLGKKPCELPIVEMKNLTVFINQNSIQKENQTMTPIINAANHFAYAIEVIHSPGQ